MIRIVNLTMAGFALFPIVAILFILGSRALSMKNKSELRLKLALIINSLLLLIPSYLGCCGKNGNLTIPIGCYMPPAKTDITEIPANFEESSDWKTLENWLIQLEDKISRKNYDADFLDKFGETVWPAIENLRKDGLITNDDSEILTAYCESRRAYYSHVIGGATCYTPVPTPIGKEAVKEDIVNATDELRSLYADGKIETDTYDIALANLEKNLQLYTEEEDNAVLRQLLLDLADGRSGGHL